MAARTASGSGSAEPRRWCRVHKTLRTSPAQAAGVTETLRDSTWIVDLVDARTPKPQKPGPAKGTKYRPRKPKNPSGAD